MPRAKSAASPSPARRVATKKTATKTIRPTRKTKSVLVDVIEDEPLQADSAWLEPEDRLIKETAPITPAPAGDELDQQKKFFSNLAQAGQSRPATALNGAGDKNKAHRRVGLYRRLVIKFVVLVGILAAIVAYFSFSELTITLNLAGENLNDSLLLKVSAVTATSTATATPTAYQSADGSDPRQPVSGTIQVITATTTKTYQSSGETYLGQEIVGTVNIINNYNKSQALVATTRLLSPDNRLFRIKNAVTVPAGGQVTVPIYVDKPSPDMAIGPTTFTIPGLWAGLQDKIYAQSSSAFVYQQKVRKYVNASDLDQATADISDALLTAAKAQASSTLPTSQNWLYTVANPPTVTINAKLGDKVDQFTANASGQIVAVSFDKNQAANLAEAKLNLLIPDDKELTNFNPENIIYSLDSYDPASQTATIKAVFTGSMILKSDSAEISPAQLVNLTADQIGTYLSSQPEVKSYSLNFFPSFVRRAPSLVDRIKIVVSKN